MDRETRLTAPVEETPEVFLNPVANTIIVMSRYKQLHFWYFRTASSDGYEQRYGSNGLLGIV